MKLRAFISSSSELLPIAEAVEHRLQKHIDCTLWNDGFYRLSTTTIETLSTGIDAFDLGIFVFGEDDGLKSRRKNYFSTRDNTVFEHGLFCGRFGPKRTIVLRSDNAKLKWPSNLDGFTTVKFHKRFARTEPLKSVESACRQILEELRRMVPRPGIYVDGEWKRRGTEWWTYGARGSSCTVANDDGVEVRSETGLGLMFPHSDDLNCGGQYCALRLMLTSRPASAVYISLTADGKRSFLSLCDSHEHEGWGEPQNEFMLQLPHLEPDRYQSFIIDLSALRPFIGEVRVNGFRLRRGIRVSHFCVFDERPVWLSNAVTLRAGRAPKVEITHPDHGAVVKQRCIIRGTLANPSKKAFSAKDLQVFVLAPDHVWYRQESLTIANGKWKVNAEFGDRTDEAGSEFQIACLTTNGKLGRDEVKILPPSLGRSIITVTRTKWKPKARNGRKTDVSAKRRSA
jgi:hypothetical protein